MAYGVMHTCLKFEVSLWPSNGCLPRHKFCKIIFCSRDQSSMQPPWRMQDSHMHYLRSFQCFLPLRFFSTHQGFSPWPCLLYNSWQNKVCYGGEECRTAGLWTNPLGYPNMDNIDTLGIIDCQLKIDRIFRQPCSTYLITDISVL